MAGMFYSLQEVIEKLNKTEEEIKQIVRQGKLREFRDGPNLLFKVDEVETLMSDTGIMAVEEVSAGTEQQAQEEEISLASETTETPAVADELTDADTIMAAEESDILGETDRGQQLKDDTMGEAKLTPDEAALASAGEASLEEIEEDVSLDTFGSGSGLLDLSLQADDTSLGGILDEIYTPEGEQPAEAGSAMEMATETEQMLSETVQPITEAPPIAAAYVEPEPDTLSNALGFMLFLPLLAIVYTAIVAVGGFSNVTPIILKKIQAINGPYDIHIIWYVMAGAAVLAALIVGIPLMSSGKPTATKKPKAKKVKKPKEPKKPKKLKKAKS